jgi:hypothetical protein
VEPVFFVLFAAVAIGIAIYSYQQDQKRRAALQQFALSKGWRYEGEDPALTVFAQGSPFGEGDNQRAQNVLHGSVSGADMVAFDYTYETHSTDTKGNRTTTTHRYAICALALPASLPEFELVPEGFLGRVGTMLGMQDIELESDEFNQRFNVSARDRKFACDVLTPRTMQALLTAPPTNWRIEGPLILSWASGRLQPVDLLARLSTLSTVVAGVPSFVWRDYSTNERPAS